METKIMTCKACYNQYGAKSLLVLQDEEALVFIGDVIISNYSFSDWLTMQKKETRYEGRIFFFIGDVVVDGYVTDRDEPVFCFFNGSLTGFYLSSSDSYFTVAKNCTIKYAIVGIQDNGYIGVEGITKVPYILNKHQPMDFLVEGDCHFIKGLGNASNNIRITKYIGKNNHDNIVDTVQIKSAAFNEAGILDQDLFMDILEANESPFESIGNK
jgi:hypothetical protein